MEHGSIGYEDLREREVRQKQAGAGRAEHSNW